MFAMQRMQRAAAPAMRTARRNMSGHSAEEAKAETLEWKKYSASTCLESTCFVVLKPTDLVYMTSSE